MAFFLADAGDCTEGLHARQDAAGRAGELMAATPRRIF